MLSQGPNRQGPNRTAASRRERVRCDRCTIEFRVATPETDDSVWIVCPDCGVRFWHGKGAAKGVAVEDGDEVQALWTSASAGPSLTF